MKKIMKEIISSVKNFMKNYDYDNGLKTYCDNEYKDNADYVFLYVKKYKKFPYQN
jgi:hypothetical protein